MELLTNKPYQEYLGGSYKLRVFSEDVSEQDLVWHKDKEDTMIQVISGHKWQFQFEDESPFELRPGMTFDVPKETYHRIIKGEEILRVKIYE